MISRHRERPSSGVVIAESRDVVGGIITHEFSRISSSNWPSDHPA